MDLIINVMDTVAVLERKWKDGKGSCISDPAHKPGGEKRFALRGSAEAGRRIEPPKANVSSYFPVHQEDPFCGGAEKSSINLVQHSHLISMKHELSSKNAQLS